MDDNEWVNSEKEACSASFSYWAATGKSTGWNWPLGWKRSNEENRHLPTSFLGLFYPTLKKKLKSETMILGGGPCSQSVRRPSFLISFYAPILLTCCRSGRSLVITTRSTLGWCHSAFELRTMVAWLPYRPAWGFLDAPALIRPRA